MLAILNDRERLIIGARFGSNGVERTLRELGHDLGVSAERVRLIQEARPASCARRLPSDSGS